MSILETCAVHWPDEAATAASAAALAARLGTTPAYLELHGTLGAGKTTFTRYLLRALGVKGTIKSPTYAVLESYDVAGTVVSHFDFYRFDDPQEWEDAGFRDVFAAAGLKIAEWPDKAAGLLPSPDLRITLVPAEQGLEARDVQIDACTPLGLTLLPHACA